MPKSSLPDLTLFLNILLKLEEFNIPYVIIGGFAATMYGITRATYDIDIIVKLEDIHCQVLADAYPLPRYYADPYQMTCKEYICNIRLLIAPIMARNGWEEMCLTKQVQPQLNVQFSPFYSNNPYPSSLLIMPTGFAD